MKIMGMQKLTLLDYPQHVAATLFTGGCQLDCPFCHNSELIEMPLLAEIEEGDVLAFLKKRTGLLDGVCITGGEPLVQKDLERFMAQVKDLGYKVKLDTNGGFPNRLASIIKSGLVDYVAMDIKNTIEKYPQTCGLPNMDVTPYIQSRNLLLEGHIDYEFRTTIVKEFHTFEDILTIAKTLEGAKRYYLQSYVEREQVRNKSLSAYSEEDLHALLSEVRKHLEVAEMRGV